MLDSRPVRCQNEGMSKHGTRRLSATKCEWVGSSSVRPEEALLVQHLMSTENFKLLPTHKATVCGAGSDRSLVRWQ